MASGVLTVFHASDFQCGAPFVPRAADAMVRLAAAVQPDAIVVSGDLTQRAKVREFDQARALLDRLDRVPLVLTPGNHDVPLYRFWERLVCPYRNWRRFAGSDLDSVTRVQGGTFVALNSSAPRRAIVNGRINDLQLDFARRCFAQSPESDLRILVIHHHFAPVVGGDGGNAMPRAAHLARAFEEMRVDAVLGGHVHQLHIRTTSDVLGTQGRHPTPLVACGTTTSRRGRGPEAGWNSLTVLRFAEGGVTVTPYQLRPEGQDFEALERLVFPIEPGGMIRTAGGQERTR